MIFYDNRIVAIHAERTAGVLLINEAPGPVEAMEREPRVPLIGQQGGNLYRMLFDAEVRWAKDFNVDGRPFAWPTKLRASYKNFGPDNERSFALRDGFLETRKRYIACTNAYSRWPRPAHKSSGFMPPLLADVLGDANLVRLRAEIGSVPACSILLICGAFAYAACFGSSLPKPAKLEGKRLKLPQLNLVNGRLASHFNEAYYMGHTRRWAQNRRRIRKVLADVAKQLNW